MLDILKGPGEYFF